MAAPAARPPPPKVPNPCAALRPPPSPARRPDAAPWPARPKDAPCPTSGGDRAHSEQLKKATQSVMNKPSGGTYSKPEARVKLIPAEDITYDAPCPTSGGDRGRSGQCKKATENILNKPSGGTYSKPEARVKLIPAEDITYVWHGLEKRHCRRSVTPPPSSRKVSLARPTPIPHEARTPVSPKAAAQLTHQDKAELTHKPASPLAHKPTTPPPPVPLCFSAKRFETAENSQIVSLNRPSPLCKAVQKGTVPPAVLRKELEMNPISPSSVHVLPAHSSKVRLSTRAEPFSGSVSKLDNTKICSTSNTKNNADPTMEKEHTVELSLLSPTSVLSSTEVCPETRSRPSSLNLFSGKCKLASLQSETSMPRAISPQSTTQEPCVEMSRDFEDAPSTKRTERQTNLEASISCNMSSGAPAISRTELYKKPDQSKYTTEAPRVELSNGFEAVPSTKINTRNQRQTNQEASVRCNMSSGAPAILDTELYKKPYQPESKTPGPFVDLSNDLDDVPSTKSHMWNERQANQESPTSCDVPSSTPLTLHTEPHKDTYRPDACWKGKFEVTGELTHTCDEIEAHFPLEIFIKVYEASKQMPEVLKLEALPLFHLLPKKFKVNPPDAKDIGLCFISSHQRTNRNFDHLLEKISSQIGLRADIGTTELLLFSSKLLREDDQKKDGKFYFCGIFRKGLRKSGIKLDLTGEEGTNGINKCMPVLKTPDANANSKAAPAVSFFTRSCSPVSAGSPCKAATRAPACGDIILDSRPGFPLDAPPPGFTSAHRQLRTGETASSSLVLDSPGDVPPACGDLILDSRPGFPLDVPPPGFTSAHRRLCTGETPSSSLVLDSPGDAPPGFTPAHHGLHINGVSTLFPEKSTIKFSLNITRPVVPPGFSKPTENVNESEIKNDKVAVEVDDGSEERQFPKIKRLSDILGFSSSNDASTSSRPGNCSKVCVTSAAVPRANKFQETGPPEIPKLCKKRGRPEASESSAAEATKRLKVNGRIALNRSMDRCAPNSSQAQGNGGKS